MFSNSVKLEVKYSDAGAAKKQLYDFKTDFKN